MIDAPSAPLWRMEADEGAIGILQDRHRPFFRQRIEGPGKIQRMAVRIGGGAGVQCEDRAGADCAPFCALHPNHRWMVGFSIRLYTPVQPGPEVGLKGWPPAPDRRHLRSRVTLGTGKR